MNDFTKEELKDIHYALTEYGNFESAPVKTLGDKIQSMIDNYCEHEWIIEINDNYIPVSGQICMYCKTGRNK